MGDHHLSVLYTWFWKLLDVLIPPHCVGCDRLGERWCIECQKQVSRIIPPLCPLCGIPSAEGGLCVHCIARPMHVTAIRSWGAYEGTLREAIHQLKYRHNIGLGEVLAKPMVEIVKANHWQVDIVIPVPLSKNRYRQRGYNQASLLALPIALSLQKPFIPQALKRIKDNPSQVTISAAQRRVNVLGAFEAPRQFVQDKKVLVVDDVITTGSTFAACSDVLFSAGARDVFCLSLARAGRLWQNTL